MPASLLDRIAALPRPVPGVAETPPLELVAFNVGARRRLYGWKQRTLANLAGVSLSTVERVERGEAVRVDALEKIGAALGWEPGYYTRPRVPLSEAQMAEPLFANTAIVPVKPLTSQAQFRALAACDSLAFAPLAGVDADDDLARELFGLIEALGVRLALPAHLRKSERLIADLGGLRDLYRMISVHLAEMRRTGVGVIAGVLHEPDRDSKRRAGVIGIGRRAEDPAILARKILILDRREMAGEIAGGHAG